MKGILIEFVIFIERKNIKVVEIESIDQDNIYYIAENELGNTYFHYERGEVFEN